MKALALTFLNEDTEGPCVTHRGSLLFNTLKHILFNHEYLMTWAVHSVHSEYNTFPLLSVFLHLYLLFVVTLCGRGNDPVEETVNRKCFSPWSDLVTNADIALDSGWCDALTGSALIRKPQFSCSLSALASAGSRRHEHHVCRYYPDRVHLGVYCAVSRRWVKSCWQVEKLCNKLPAQPQLGSILHSHVGTTLSVLLKYINYFFHLVHYQTLVAKLAS